MYRPIDVLTVQRRGERERRAVQPCRSFLGRFWGGVPHTFSSPYIFSHCCYTVAALTRPTFLSHTHSTHQKIEKMFEQEIEVEDINASDSKRGGPRPTNPNKPKYPRLTPAHVGP